MAQNTGTLIGAAIRPNDSLDPIASAFASEIKGGLHTAASSTDRNNIIIERREWGMMCYVTNLDKTFQLKFGYSSANIMDNSNWVEFSGSGGGGSSVEWIDSVLTIGYNEPPTPSNGDRYLVGVDPSSILTGASWSSFSPGVVAQWNSTLSRWDLTTPTEGMTVNVDDELNAMYRYEGTYPTGGWSKEKVQQIRSVTLTTIDSITYTGQSSPPFSTYDPEMIFLVTFSTTNTSSIVNLNINSIGSVQVKKPSNTGLVDFEPNELVPNVLYSLTYDGTYFQSVKPFSNDDSFAIKYYVEPTDLITVPPYYQYWVYGDLTVAGQILNYGHVVIANGNLVMAGGTFSNIGGGQLALVNLSSSGTSSITLNDTDTIDFQTQNLITGLSASAFIKTSSLTASLLNTGNSGGATAGYVLSNTSDGNFKWVPSSNLSVSDYINSTTYSNVSSIIFRGGVVSVPGGTATGVLAVGPSPTVTVWIPAPNYVGYFSPTLGSGAFTRYISTPSTNGYTSSISSGYYGTGNWNTATDFTSNTTRNVTNSSGSLTAFTEAEFGCFSNGTTMSFTLYNHDGSILSEINGFTVSSGNTLTNGSMTITVNSFLPDSDRFKASVTGTFSVGANFPNGGRFNWNVTHYNGEGPGNVSYGVYSFSQSTPVFYDNDGSSSSSNISGTVDFNELSATVVYYSGVAFYDTGSTFALTASGINLLNDLTIPLSKQIDFTSTNLGVSGTLDGHTNGTKGYGTAITGWTLDWNKSGLTFSSTATVNISNTYVPGFSTNNTISTSPSTTVTSRIYDYGLVGSSQSTSRLMLIDTYSVSSVTYNNNPLDSETGRLSTTGVLSNGSAGFTSSNVLANDELQYIFGRVIYPQTNFTLFYPLVNATASVNYSALSGSNKTFTVYTDISIGSTTSVTFNDYRWHVTSYGKDASYINSFTNGIFTLNSNFTESVLDYNGVLSSSGSGDLVILVGIDDTSNNTTPNKFLFVSGDPSTYGTRQNPITYNLNNATESSKTIQWSKGTLSPVVKKCWLFIGYKNSATGKNLRITNIAFA
jgi:hypothetical protein